MANKTPKKNRWLNILRNITIGVILIIIVFIIYFNQRTKITPPIVNDKSSLSLVRENPSKDFYKIKNCWLKKNNYGLWEMYLEGNPFEIGVINGKLTKELIKIQEDAFVEQINKMIPSKAYLRFLKYFIAWFNRDIDDYIPQEYIEEIYGVSFGASDGYEYIGNNYERMLNYHGAHDIGHALQSLALVGCTSFVTNMNSPDSSMILGRNFDFYINETFAQNKILVMVKPDNGHEFIYLTWASMIGVVSGMNKVGITVTINAAKSDIPTKAKMPISLLAREILQYAGNISEAIEIASKRETFVSESILVASASDKKAVIIEKSPSKTDVFETADNKLICSNHFQSDAFKDDENNTEYIAESATSYRYQRCTELINDFEKVDYLEAAKILRDSDGLNNRNIGIGNEKAMAQFISHHSVIFEPEKLNTWVSTQNYQFGAMLMYNLPYIFKNAYSTTANTVCYDSAYTISADSSIILNKLGSLKAYRKSRDLLKEHIQYEKLLENEDEFIDSFISLNPEYYHTYVLAANYYYSQNNNESALKYYKLAVTKEFENKTTQEMVNQRIDELSVKKP